MEWPINRTWWGRRAMGIGAGAAAGIAAAAVSAGTGIASAVGGGSAQSSDISQGQSAANAAQQQALSQYSSNEQPYISTGTNALSSLANADGLNGALGNASALSAFQASPGYQYQVSQGLSAIDNGAASIGTLRTGNTVRAEETLGSNLANQDFTNYLGRLNSLAGLGQTATQSLGSAGVSTGAGIASTDTSAANAQSGIAGNTANGVGKAVQGLASTPSVQNALSGIGGSGNTNYNASLAGTVNGSANEAII